MCFSQHSARAHTHTHTHSAIQEAAEESHLERLQLRDVAFEVVSSMLRGLYVLLKGLSQLQRLVLASAIVVSRSEVQITAHSSVRGLFTAAHVSFGCHTGRVCARFTKTWPWPAYWLKQICASSLAA